MYFLFGCAACRLLCCPHLPHQYSTTSEPVDLSPVDIVVPTVGWIVTFPSSSMQEKSNVSGDSDGMVIGVVGASEMWDWWVWLVFGLLVLCCLLPLFFFMCCGR